MCKKVVSVHSEWGMRWGQSAYLTWIANHAVFGPNRANDFFIITFALTPGIRVLFRHSREFRI
jgi:hypothetical protein